MTYDQIASLVTNESNDSVYVADIDTYELLYVNNMSLEMLGYPEEHEWMHRPCYEVIQGKDKPCEFCTNSLITSDKFYIWEHHNEKINRYFEIKDKLIEYEGRRARLEIAVDITEKKKNEQMLYQKYHVEETLVDCIQTLNQYEDIRLAINKLLQIVGGYYQADRAYIFEFDYDRNLLVYSYEWCKDGVESQIDNIPEMPMSSAERWMKQFRTKGEYYITSAEEIVETNLDGREILKTQGINSMLATPLYLNTEMAGFLGVDNPTENPGEMTLLHSVSSFVSNDISKRQMLTQLWELSYTDGLTGLKNRRSYINKLKELEEKHLRCLGIVFVDINGLKIANDKFGHEHGDAMICHTAEIIKRWFGQSVYRIGGDEFVVLVENMDKDCFEEKTGLLRKAANIDPTLNFSVGSTWEEGNLDISRQISHTDELMYIDKQAYYGDGMIERGHYQAKLSGELIDQIERGEFEVYLQPKITLHTSKLNGAEALIRLRKDGQIIPPSHFIPRYEMEGIVRHIDFYVLETVCDLLRKWKEQGMEQIAIAVNFSKITLQEYNIVDKLLAVCKKRGVSTQYINIEVTESIGSMKKEQLEHLIDNLKEAGFTVSLDNFGAEYSNLAIISALGFDEIKLDKSLIDNLEKSGRSRIIARHAIEMCQELELNTSVAEGVETAEQRDLLDSYQCNVGQGYFYDRPMPIGVFENKYFPAGAKKI